MQTAFCFDLDDTLYDYEQYARSGLLAAGDWLEERTGQRFHADLLDLYFTEGITGSTFDQLVERHDLPQGIVVDLVERFHAASDPIDPYPDAKRVLSRLASEHALGLLTDGRGGREKLDRLGLRDHFDAVMETHPIGRSKPDPAVFHRLLVALSVEPRNAVYVGDDPRVDFRGANTLGMGTVRLRRGRYTHLEPVDSASEPDHEIDELGELLDLVVSSGTTAAAGT